MSSFTPTRPGISVRQPLATWPLWGTFVGTALWIVLRNPALDLSVAAFSGMVFFVLNVRHEGRRARTVQVLALVVSAVAIALTAIGNPTFEPATVAFLLGLVALLDTYLPKRR